MIAIFSLLLILTISILITRIGSVALMHTGLSQESAHFQAYSAFTGAGFTTSESEMVVTHPVRRKIVQILMIAGNAGIVTAVSSLMLTFISVDDIGSTALRLGLLLPGLILLWFLNNVQWVDEMLNSLISWALKKYTHLDVRDYTSLLRLSGDYRVTELLVEPQDWLTGKSLRTLRLNDEGVLVLGIFTQKNQYIGSPNPGTVIHAGDMLVIYGRITTISALDQRSRGDVGEREHSRAVREQRQVVEQEEHAGDENL